MHAESSSALVVNRKADENMSKTLLLSLSFFFKFSSVQENPSNQKLANMTMVKSS